jgi:hypothetical protein
MLVSLSNVDSETFGSLGWMKRQAYIVSFSPILFKIHTWSTNLWVWGEMIVLLTNKRKRAIHDFIAGTVIVKAIYVNKIREVMNSNDNEKNETANSAEIQSKNIGLSNNIEL